MADFHSTNHVKTQFRFPFTQKKNSIALSVSVIVSMKIYENDCYRLSKNNCVILEIGTV